MTKEHEARECPHCGGKRLLKTIAVDKLEQDIVEGWKCLDCEEMFDTHSYAPKQVVTLR